MLFQKIKQLAEEKGTSIRAVENDAGLSNGTISKWDKSVPSVKNLQAVAEALDVPLEYLLVDEVAE